MPNTIPSTHVSMPPVLANPAPPVLEIDKPLAMKFPAFLELEVELVLELFDAEGVVVALLLAGVLAMVLVFPLTTSAVPFLSSEYVVPDTVIASPGFRVVPGETTYSVVPSRTVAETVLPPMVSAGAAVTWF